MRKYDTCCCSENMSYFYKSVIKNVILFWVFFGFFNFIFGVRESTMLDIVFN